MHSACVRLELWLKIPGHRGKLLAMLTIPVWAQVCALSFVVLLLHLRQRGKWRAPTMRLLRESAAAIVFSVLAFLAISGGRGCAGSTALDEIDDGVTIDAPDPFHRSR
jgi:hypothetical protein